MRGASPDPSTRRRRRVSRPISSARVSPRPVSALSLACLLLALFVPVREVSATRAFGSPAPRPAPGIIAAEGGRFVDPSDGSTFHVAGAISQGAGLLQQLVHQGGLAVVNVGDDGDIAQAFNHRNGSVGKKVALRPLADQRENASATGRKGP